MRGSVRPAVMALCGVAILVTWGLCSRTPARTVVANHPPAVLARGTAPTLVVVPADAAVTVHTPLPVRDAGADGTVRQPATSRVLVRGGWGTAPGLFGRAEAHESNPEIPMAVVPGEGEGVLVLDQVNRRVQRFEPGRPPVVMSIRSEATQDLARLPGGGLAVLDRLGEAAVQVFDPSGQPGARIPVVGGAMREGGAVTGLFADANGLYLEREHQDLVEIADAQGQPVADRQTLWGRPSRDGRWLLRAAITDRAAGDVTVTATARGGNTPGWATAVHLRATILTVVMLDSDRRGRTYVAAETATVSPDPPYTLDDARVTVVRLGTEGAVEASLDLPPLPPADETFRPLAVQDDGTVLALSPGPDGLAVVAWHFSE